MELYEAIRGRRTTGAFQDDPPSRAVIERLLDAAIWAPNHHLTEPWRFVVIAGEARQAFGEALGDWLEAGGSGAPADERDLRRARNSMLGTPVTIAVAQAIAADTDEVTTLEDYAACCAAVQNLMLAAHAEGLGTKWATGRLTRYTRAKELLGLDARDRIVGYVMLGYPAPDPKAEEPHRGAPPVVWQGL